MNYFKSVFLFSVLALAGCAKPQSHDAVTHSVAQPRMTAAQAIEVAKSHLPLPVSESYRAQFKDGVWTVWTEPRPGAKQQGWETVTIRDSDGQILQTKYF